jgi:hypothetical protein
MPTTHVDHWCAGRPLILAQAASEFADGADDVLGWVMAVRDGKAASRLPKMPSALAWTKLYRRHRKIRQVLSGAFLPASSGLGVADLEEMQRAVYLMQAMEPEALAAELQKMGPEAFKDAATTVEALVRLMTGKIEPEEASLDKGLETAEVAFFLLVWLPCWLEHGDYPPRLMRRARQGNMEALEDLLRLDHGAVADPKIAGHLGVAGLDREGARGQRLTKALHESPKRRLNAQSVKVLLAALVLKMSVLLEVRTKSLPPEGRTKRLTVPEIRDLFDATARDKGQGRIDTDLPESPEAFYMAVHRQADFWQLPL